MRLSLLLRDKLHRPPAQPLPPTSVATDPSPTQVTHTAAKQKPDEVENSRDAEKDRTSLNTSTHTHTRTQSTRPKEEKKSNSELAHTASTSAGVEEQQGPKNKRTKSKKAKPSLFSKLFHALVPCIGPSAKYAHPADVDLKSPATKEPAPPPSEMKEKPLVNEPVPSATEQPSPPPKDTVPEQSTAPRQTTPIPPPLQPIDVPPPSDDPTVVVPATPTKTLPPEETAGLTSGAVQPPGSRGPTKREDSLHEAHRHGDSENESDASTNFTDDEEGEDGTHMDEVEDEEERLIANGGAGIPVGPVRVLAIASTVLPLTMCTCRMVCHVPSFLRCQQSMQGENALCLIWTRPWCTAASKYVFSSHI